MSLLEKASGIHELWIYPVVFIGISLFVVLCADNTAEMTDRFRPDLPRAAVTILLLAWCVMNFANVGTFIYAGF